MLSLLSMLFGGLLRLVPEVIKYLDKKNDRSHELSMMDKTLEHDRLRIEAQAQAQAHELDLAEIQSLIEATKVQGSPSGIKWVDALSASVRPVLTYWWCIVIYTSVKVSMLIQGGAFVPTMWTEWDQSVVGSMVGFWFVDRTLRKRK